MPQAHNVVEEGETIAHGAPDGGKEQPVDRSHKAAPPPEPEAGEGVKVVDGEVKELTVKDGEVQPES